MCNQLPYTESKKPAAARNRGRRLGEIDPDEVLIKQNITNRIYVPPEADEVLPVLYNWWITDFGNADMHLQLNFTNPLLVSAYFDKDKLQIQIQEEVFFLATSDYQYIAPNYILTAKYIPPLLPMDDLKRLPINVSRSYWTEFLPLVFSFLALICLGRIWTIYLMMQIVSNIDNYSRVIIPAEAQQLLDQLEKISNLKLTSIKALQNWFKTSGLNKFIMFNKNEELWLAL